MAGVRLYQVYLKVNDIKYVCTNATIEYAINDVPQAKVTVGCGVPLVNPKDNDDGMSPEKLLNEVLNRRGMAYKSMVPCTVLVDVDKSDSIHTITLLEGFIASGAVHYTASPTTSRTITFLCMHKACMLMVKPVADYVYMFNNAIAVALANQDDIDSTSDTIARPVSSIDELEREEQVGILLETIDDNTPVSTIIGMCIDNIVKLQSYYHEYEDDKGPSVNVTSYLGSDYGLNTSDLVGADGSTILDTATREAYVGAVYGDVLTLMETNDIFTTIKALVDINHRCLSIIPKGADKDFKLYIEPSKAWINKSTLTLYPANINSIKSTFAPLSCLYTPDVFMVSFDPAVQNANDVNDLFQTTGEKGVFAITKELTDYIKTQQSKGEAIDPNAYNRVKCITAPKWLMHCFWQDKYIAMKEDPNALPKHKKNTKEGDNTSVATNSRFSKDEKAIKAADAIAKAMFTHMYGNSETSNIELTHDAILGYEYLSSPTELDTGYLHEMLGEVIDIDMSNNSKDKDSPLSIRGRLCRVEISYSAGTDTAFEYSITLDCVRPLNNKNGETIDIACPLYKEIKNG